MSERESTASNIATDLLGRLNNKLRSELVRHVDEYFQKTDFQNSLAFPNIHESNNHHRLHQDSEDTQAVEFLIDKLKDTKTNDEFFTSMKRQKTGKIA